MSSTSIFYALGDFMQWTFILLEADMIGNLFNYAVIILGFVGLFYWLNLQKKLTQKAKDEGKLI